MNPLSAFGKTTLQQLQNFNKIMERRRYFCTNKSSFDYEFQRCCL